MGSSPRKAPEDRKEDEPVNDCERLSHVKGDDKFM